MKILNKYGVMLEPDEDEVDEGLGTYWECVNEHDRREWYLDELHMQKNLNIITLDDYAFEKLRDERPGKRIMTTTPNYEMVSNPKYAEAFQYVPIHFRDTDEEKETSDMVLKILNLAYIPEEEQNFKFESKATANRTTPK
jgi:hypothetical protein